MDCILIRTVNSFNPRSREGSDPELNSNSVFECNVSIHAPAKGATHDLIWFLDILPVSIHAPAKGATAKSILLSASS